MRLACLFLGHRWDDAPPESAWVRRGGTLLGVWRRRWCTRGHYVRVGEWRKP